MQGETRMKRLVAEARGVEALGQIVSFGAISPVGVVSAKELIPGGRASGKKPSDFDPEQLALGAAVEMEHTKNPRMALEIAMDHLTEDPKYYDKLLAMGL